MAHKLKNKTAMNLLSILPILVVLALALWLSTLTKIQTPHPSTGTTDNPVTGSLDRGFDVILNFRGPDSRHTITDVLYGSLTRAGYRVFLDDEEIRKGETIQGEILSAITNSRIYIPIFSKDYASSRWCLRELAIMIDCWETSSSSSSDTKKVILPIFYDVDVSKDVKLRSQVYTAALQKHKEELGEVIVKPWEDTLRKVARIKGWNLKDHGLSELADLINREVFTKLTSTEADPTLSNPLVGIDEPVKEVMELLEEGYPDVRFIVIHGMGGIGKTTLADAVFKKISSKFQGSCFLRDVRRLSSDHDMVKLQEKLLSDTLNLKFIKVSGTNDGINKISKRLRGQNVFIVLDDVDKRDHLLKLAANSSWFGLKSRIIITTRNIEFLPNKANEEYFFYAMKGMGSDHALQLFSRHAFERDSPPPELYGISTQIVATTGGLPLALQVIGSSLYNQGDATWKFRLEKLKNAPHKDVQETLMISYQALEYEQQQIFLDVACFFNDEKMIDPIYFWEACKYYPHSGIDILVRRSMIKVNDDNKLWIHDQLRDLGRAISQAKMTCLENQLHSKSSKFWDPEVALAVLQKQEVDENVLALNLGALDVDSHFTREQFARGAKLNFLQLRGGNFEGDFENVFHQLVWLSWSDCPLRFEVANLSFKNLAVLKLSKCEITENWGGWRAFMGAKNLKIMHLESCKFLKKTPDLSSFLRLERLIIKNCVGLEEIDSSVNKLEHLKYLEISDYGFLKGIEHGFSSGMPAQPHFLPDSIGGLKSLIELRIRNAGLTRIPASIGELVSLKLLRLSCPQLKILPGSVGKLILLEELDLSFSGIKEPPNSIGELKRLKILRMEFSAVEHLPDTIGRLESLQVLNLYSTQITQLPEAIGRLESLELLDLFRTPITQATQLPEAIRNLNRKSLRVLGTFITTCNK